jgi:hypothetical protein
MDAGLFRAGMVRIAPMVRADRLDVVDQQRDRAGWFSCQHEVAQHPYLVEPIRQRHADTDVAEPASGEHRGGQGDAGIVERQHGRIDARAHGLYRQRARVDAVESGTGRGPRTRRPGRAGSKQADKQGEASVHDQFS